MREALPFAILAVAFAAILLGLRWLAARMRRRGIGGAVMSVVDEVFRPTAQVSYQQIQAQDRRMNPIMAPGEPEHPAPPAN